MSQRTKPPFRADHVGSLLRPSELKGAREKFAKDEIDAAGLKAVEDRAGTAPLPTSSENRKQSVCSPLPTVNSVAPGGISTSCGASTASKSM
jgi:hypothetical protein